MQVGQEAIKTILYVAGPMLGLSLIVGLMVSAFQAMTQINEMTLSFIPKLVITVLVLMLAGPWMLRLIMDYTQQLIQDIPHLIG